MMGISIFAKHLLVAANQRTQSYGKFIGKMYVIKLYCKFAEYADLLRPGY